MNTHRAPLVVAAALLLGIAPAAHAETPQPDREAGQAAYQQQCARCHGATGAGDGLDAKRLFPKPRDFTSGMYKFRTTASGTAPTDGDLFQTITNGLPGSGMPDWGHLDEATRWQLVYYLKTLSSAFADNPPQPITVGQNPGRKRVDLAQGKQVYEKLGCAACHGAEGRANGTSAPSLVDGWGLPTRPANLTEGWNYRGGASPAAIVARVFAGIDGSVMPSYAEAATPEDVWQLAYYVESLQRQPRWAIIVRAPFLADGLPASPDDPRWQRVVPVDIRLRNVVDANGELTAPTSVTTALLQVAYNDEAINFRLQWDDATQDTAEAPDALAVFLRPPAVRGDVVSLQTWPLLKSAPALDLCFWSAGRPAAPGTPSPAGMGPARSAARYDAREAVVRDVQPLVVGSESGVSLMSQAAYANGRWTLMLTRPLAQPGVPEAAQLAAKQFLPIGLAVWDGANAGSHAVSTWVDVSLQGPTELVESKGSLMVVWIISGIVLVVALALAFRK